MIYSSVGLVFIGVIGTAGALIFLSRKEDPRMVNYAWLLGIAAMVPAWLVAVLSLLGTTPTEVIDTPLPPSILITSAAALLGVIFTDVLNRRLLARDNRPGSTTLWLLGIVAFVPAWIIALWALG